MAKKSSAWLRKAYRSVAMNGRARTRLRSDSLPFFSFPASSLFNGFSKIARVLGYSLAVWGISNENPVISGEAKKKKGVTDVKKRELFERSEFSRFSRLRTFSASQEPDLIFFRFLFSIKRKKE